MPKVLADSIIEITENLNKLDFFDLEKIARKFEEKLTELKGENKTMIILKYFETIKQAQDFIKNNNIKDYYFTTPEFLENGIDLNFSKK